jgi:hypothetical protein
MAVTIEIHPELEVDVADYPLILPHLKHLLETSTPTADELWADYQVLLEYGLADQGRLTVNPAVILAALNYVPFDEEMNRTSQY